jgi:hypothetical protein
MAGECFTFGFLRFCKSLVTRVGDSGFVRTNWASVIRRPLYMGKTSIGVAVRFVYIIAEIMLITRNAAVAGPGPIVYRNWGYLALGKLAPYWRVNTSELLEKSFDVRGFFCLKSARHNRLPI